MSQSPINKRLPLGLLLFITIAAALIISQSQFADATGKGAKKDVNRRSIVFDIKTPKVFYCPQEKQADLSKMIVMAKPLDKLCEFGGKPKPKSSPSDCYNDLDETEFACDEKKRFLIRLDAPIDADQMTTTAPESFDDQPEYMYVSKGLNKKKVSPNGKKL